MSPFDIQRMLLDEFPLSFLLEVVLRAAFAFLAVFLFLKSSGRRESGSYRFLNSWLS